MQVRYSCWICRVLVVVGVAGRANDGGPVHRPPRNATARHPILSRPPPPAAAAGKIFCVRFSGWGVKLPWGKPRGLKGRCQVAFRRRNVGGEVLTTAHAFRHFPSTFT